MSDNGGAAGAGPRELEIRAEVEALLTKLYLPRYAAVLDPVLFSLLSAAMAQNMGAIEHRFELEADKRRRQCEGDRQPQESTWKPSTVDGRAGVWPGE